MKTGTVHYNADPILTAPLMRDELRALLELLKHGVPQRSVESCLVALALLLEPSDDTGIKARGELALHWPIERIADSILPKVLRWWRNI